MVLPTRDKCNESSSNKTSTAIINNYEDNLMFNPHYDIANTAFLIIPVDVVVAGYDELSFGPKILP